MTHMGQPFHYVEMVGPPDRTQFIRDAEAAMRLRSPVAAMRFLESLCDARARAELHCERYHTQADRDALHRSRKRELLAMCRAMGFLATRVTEVEFRMFFKLDE